MQRADEVDATAAERRAALASRLVPRDQNQVPVLSEVLLSGELPYVAVIRERLRLGLRRGELPVDEPLFECSVVPLYEPRFSSGPESVREPAGGPDGVGRTSTSVRQLHGRCRMGCW